MNGPWDDEFDRDNDARDAGVDPAVPHGRRRVISYADMEARLASDGSPSTRTATGPGPAGGDAARRMRDRLPPALRDRSQYAVSEPYGPKGPLTVVNRRNPDGSVPTLRAFGTPYPDPRPPIGRAAAAPYRFTPAGPQPTRLDRVRNFPPGPVMDAVDFALRLRDRADAALRGTAEQPVDRRGPRKR